MKLIHIGLFLLGGLFVTACSDSTKPELPISDTVSFSGSVYSYDQIEVNVGAVVNDPEWCYLNVRLSDTDGGLVSFTAQDPGGDPFQLLTEGEHGASSQSSNTIYCNLTEARVGFYGLTGDQLSIVWETVNVGEQTYSGHGYIHLKKRIDYACADSVHTAYGVFGPGSEVYDRYFDANCAPGFFFAEQKIRFDWEEDAVW